MKREIIARSQVPLMAEITARNIEDKIVKLTTVREAMRFLDANFPPGRLVEQKFQNAAKALQNAAATGNATQRENATKVLISVLQSEGMLERPGLA